MKKRETGPCALMRSSKRPPCLACGRQASSTRQGCSWTWDWVSASASRRRCGWSHRPMIRDAIPKRICSTRKAFSPIRRLWRTRSGTCSRTSGFRSSSAATAASFLGPALALRGAGRHGLLFVDGHMDYWDARLEPYGEAASMDLALVTGNGPRFCPISMGSAPISARKTAVAYGTRDHLYSSDFIETPLSAGTQAHRRQGSACARRTRRRTGAGAADQSASSRASGSILMSMCWTMRSCRRSITG